MHDQLLVFVASTCSMPLHLPQITGGYQCHHLQQHHLVLVLSATPCTKSRTRTRLSSHKSHRKTYPRSHHKFCVELSRESSNTTKLSFFTALQTPFPPPELLFYFIPNSGTNLHPLPFVQHKITQDKRSHRSKRNYWEVVYSSLKQRKFHRYACGRTQYQFLILTRGIISSLATH